MANKLYMDHNVSKAISDGLKARGVDVLTCQQDETTELADSELMNRASELGRVLFSMDFDLLREATQRQRNNIPFTGIIYAHQLRVPIGICIDNLEIIAKVGDPEDMINRVVFLPF